MGGQVVKRVSRLENGLGYSVDSSYVTDRLLNETRLSATKTQIQIGDLGSLSPSALLDLTGSGRTTGEVEMQNYAYITTTFAYQREEDRDFRAQNSMPFAPTREKRLAFITSANFQNNQQEVRLGQRGRLRCYAWKPPGSGRESAEMMDDFNDKVEGNLV